MVHLVENGLADAIRVADKTLLETSYLTPQQKAAFEKVEYMQANLARDASVAKVFKRDGDARFDFVINCAALTKYGQDEVVYEESVFTLSTKCARAAAAQGCARFIELSSAQVYDSDKVGGAGGRGAATATARGVVPQQARRAVTLVFYACRLPRNQAPRTPRSSPGRRLRP